MTRKWIVLLCVLAISLCTATPTRAAGAEDDEAGAMIADTVIARPACLAATVIGSVFFVLSLPFALASKKVPEAKELLVVNPARATFTRPLGEFNYP